MHDESQETMITREKLKENNIPLEEGMGMQSLINRNVLRTVSKRDEQSVTLAFKVKI